MFPMPIPRRSVRFSSTLLLLELRFKVVRVFLPFGSDDVSSSGDATCPFAQARFESRFCGEQIRTNGWSRASHP